MADPPLYRPARGVPVRGRLPRFEGVAEQFGAAPFDLEGVFWSHRGEKCTFDVMVEEFGLTIEPLLRLATIVRGADTGRLDLAPQAAGLLAASLGLSRMYTDDLAQLEAGLVALRCLLSLVPRCGRRNPHWRIPNDPKPKHLRRIGNDAKKIHSSGVFSWSWRWLRSLVFSTPKWFPACRARAPNRRPPR